MAFVFGLGAKQLVNRFTATGSFKNSLSSRDMATRSRICSRCKESKEDVDIRQSDEILCQACTAVSIATEYTRRKENSNEDLMITYALYENLVKNVKVKRKTVKNKPKIRFRWLGTVDLLKDFVNLVLNNSGTWSESRKSAISFKTASLTLTFYKNTKTLQLQGSKAHEVSDFLISLTEIESNTRDSNSVAVDCSPSSPPEDTHNESDSDTLAVLSEGTDHSSRFSAFSPTRPNLTQWSDMAHFKPKTPDIIFQESPNMNTDFLQQGVNKLATIETDLAKIRKEKHNQWLGDPSRKENSTETHGGNGQTAVEPELLTRLIENTNNLLVNLDVKGIFSMLKSQVERTEKLNATILDIREENLHLRVEYEKSREIMENMREENFQLRKELKAVKEMHSECSNQAFIDGPNLQNGDTANWQRPNKTFKPTSLPTRNRVAITNSYDCLSST